MVDVARTRLGRIRCLLQALDALQKVEPLPEALCYVPQKLTLECNAEESFVLYSSPSLDNKTSIQIAQGKVMKVVVKGKPCFNEDGGWVQLISPHENNWVLIQPAKSVQKVKWKICKEEDNEVVSWIDAVERTHSLRLAQSSLRADAYEDEMSKIQHPPPGWSVEADEELAQFLVQHGGKGVAMSASVGNEFVRKVEASSGQSDIENIFKPDYGWESDGDQGSHWLRFHMKPGAVVNKLALVVDPDDGSYLPKRVVLTAGPTTSTLNIITTRNFGSSDYEKKELNLLLAPLAVHYPVVEVGIKSCYQGGIDTRIQSVKIMCNSASTILPDSTCLPETSFNTKAVSRWPKLESFSSEHLYYRGILLKRVAALIDKDLTYILPPWGHLSTVFSSVSSMRQLWPLCGNRNALIDQMMQSTVESSPSDTPVLYINRIAAKQQRDDPSIEPEKRKTVFNQIFDEINKHTKPTTFNYRWAGNCSQWWECKYLQEGVIDQGGGFRDSLSEIAEELCPPSLNADINLPLFIRSPNQSQDSSNVYRDVYVPNPSCELRSKYYFIGQLMGGAFRSQETLVLPMPQFVWKHLTGEPVTWTRDFVSVDSAEVKLIDSIEGMEREKFDSTFLGVLNFTTVLSNGDTVDLTPEGENKLVNYDDRMEYCLLVKEIRMKESEKQIAAIKEGLCQVVPSQVLALMTWQELEDKICGSPEIPIDKLKQSARYESDLNEKSPRVRMMWQALESFTNEERSRFIRFITGRRRLPVNISIDTSDSGPESLPTSATCSNALYLPNYTSVEQATLKLRYAAYNCVAIDTDMSPWE